MPQIVEPEIVNLCPGEQAIKASFQSLRTPAAPARGENMWPLSFAAIIYNSPASVGVIRVVDARTPTISGF